MSEQQPEFAIEKIYVKNLSLEIPNAPHVFLERETPEINLQLSSQDTCIEQDIYEVIVIITVTSQIKEKTMFLVEAQQAGIFRIRNLSENDINPVLSIVCPNILFPYLRETVSNTVTRAGFSPVILNPVNFEAIYHQKRQQAESKTDMGLYNSIDGIYERFSQLQAFQKGSDSLSFNKNVSQSATQGTQVESDSNLNGNYGGLSGLWASLPPTSSPITSYGVSRVQERILFSPDGYFIKGTPPLDWQNVNWQDECSKRSSEAYRRSTDSYASCGRYWLEGETLFLQYTDRELSKRLWRKEGNVINAGGYYFWQATPGTPGMKLEGAYIRRPEPYIYGNVNDLPFEGGDYYFSSNGRFDIQYPVNLPYAPWSQINKLSGFYRVNGTSITLKFDIGATQNAPFFLWDGKSDVIDINGKHYSRQ